MWIKVKKVYIEKKVSIKIVYRTKNSTKIMWVRVNLLIFIFNMKNILFFKIYH